MNTSGLNGDIPVDLKPLVILDLLIANVKELLDRLATSQIVTACPGLLRCHESSDEL